MRLLESRKIPYTAHTYEPDPSLSGEDIARILGEDPEGVFKTLVTRGKTGAYYVFVIPVEEELNLKKAAAAVGWKTPRSCTRRTSLQTRSRRRVRTGSIRSVCWRSAAALTSRP